jgi:hypothetical protein
MALTMSLNKISWVKNGTFNLTSLLISSRKGKSLQQFGQGMIKERECMQNLGAE